MIKENKLRKAAFRTLPLTALTLAVALSACGKSEEPAASSSPSPAASPGASAKPAREKLTLNWIIPQRDTTANLPSDGSDFVRKAIEEKFNVTFNLVLLNGADYNNIINQKVAAREQMDLFYYDGRASNDLIKENFTKDLTNFLTPQKVPNFFKWVTEKELAAYQVQDKFMRAPFPFGREILWSYYLRKDWLDKLKLKMPTTYDEMVDVMKAFTFNDPDGNGKNDTFGFSTNGNGTSIPTEFPVFIKNKIYADFWVEDDVFHVGRTDPRYPAAIDDLRKLLDLKVVDPDWFLNKGSQALDKAAQGKIGIVYGWGKDVAFDNATNSFQKKTKETTGVQTAEWVPFNPFGDSPMGVGQNPGNFNPFLVSNKSSDAQVERSMEILNWLSGEEGFLLSHYGKEGVHYKRTGNKIELLPDAYKKDIIDKGNFLALYLPIVPNEPTILGFDVIDPKETDRDRSILAKLRSYKTLPSIGTALSVKEGMDLPKLSMQTTVIQTKLLFEDKDSSKFPQYRQELIDNYGLKTIMDWYAELVSKAQGKKIVWK
ncbi:extracellular solute-binding protein [Paenibacillus koleovorans]|uniref:extracellular solute-binding protein n=1 Tax=Paenibacillus koleovorans TaxID=121608 RepID=UPI000FD716D8|nr:extracellular solute-binding protein [Paenibacillus koleovorans]